MKTHGRLLQAAIVTSLCVRCATSAMAGTDASTFDVAGIRLGMSPAEVQAKIAEHFGVSKAKVYTLSMPQSILGGKPAIIAMNYEANGERLEVNFEVVSAKPGDPTAADRIGYKLPFSRENADRLKSAAVSKYGAPNVDSFPLQWCAKASNPALCDSGQAELSVGNTDLILKDDRYVQRSMRLRDELNTTKPRL